MIGNTWHLLFSALFMILARCCQGNMFTLLAFWADIDNFITQDSLSLIKLNYTRDRRKVCKRNKEVTWKRLLLNNFSNKDCTVQMTESSQKVRTRWKLFRQKLVFDFRIFEERFSIRWFTSSALFDLPFDSDYQSVFWQSMELSPSLTQIVGNEHSFSFAKRILFLFFVIMTILSSDCMQCNVGKLIIVSEYCKYGPALKRLQRKSHFSWH